MRVERIRRTVGLEEIRSAEYTAPSLLATDRHMLPSNTTLSLRPLSVLAQDGVAERGRGWPSRGSTDSVIYRRLHPARGVHHSSDGPQHERWGAPRCGIEFSFSRP